MPPVSFIRNPFLKHVKDSSVAISAVCLVSSPCRGFSFLHKFSSCGPYDYPPHQALLQSSLFPLPSLTGIIIIVFIVIISIIVVVWVNFILFECLLSA